MIEKIVHLNALDLDVSVPWNVSLYDDGVVGDIREHLNELFFSYFGKFESIPENFVPAGVAGGCTCFPINNKLYNFHTFYLDTAANTYQTRGHEETHFLQKINRLPLLFTQIFSEQGIGINLERISKEIFIAHDFEEIISEIGGIFAQSQRDSWQSVYEFYKSDLPRSNYFDWALAVYCEANERSMKKTGGRNLYLERIAETL